MNTPQQLAKHLRQVFFGGNWTVSCVKDQLADVDYKMAISQVAELNTIAVLTFHIHYFVKAALNVFETGELNANDKFSFDHPSIESEQDWQNMISSALNDAELLVLHLEKLPEAKLFEDFVDEKYGSHFRNYLGIIEHTHYHLGQLVMVKKLLK